MFYPGFISQKTTVVAHAETVARRIKLYASVVGRENIVASTECGLGWGVHLQIAGKVGGAGGRRGPRFEDVCGPRVGPAHS